MARIEGVSKSQAGPIVKLVYRFGPRMMKKMTGRDPQTGSGIEPMEVWAHQPKMMIGMGRFNQAVRKGKAVDERTKNLVELKGAQMIGCEYCVDLGSQICRNSGFSDEELLALPRYQSSDLFTDREKAALDYAVAVMRTPVEVTDELFARVRSYFDDRQLVEITALLTLVNLDRFNAAFGIGSAGFSEGMVCVPPDRPDPVASRSHTTRLSSALALRSGWSRPGLAALRRLTDGGAGEPDYPGGQVADRLVVLGLLGQRQRQLHMGERPLGIAEDGQRVTGEYPGPDVTGPAFHVLRDLRPRLVRVPGFGEREGRLTGKQTLPGRVDDGQRLAQHDGLGSLACPAEVTDEGDRPAREPPRLIPVLR
ncbi:MAG TPA: carboxymuconolactone decarboxylase family protein [Streptosporangiaceae bacterium]|nr:carboxymuconolactone decarboxylase family protein [Streptosporangiaceae bacterium]